MHSFVKNTINFLTDWLLILLGVSLILWFGFTLPTFSMASNSDEIKVSQKLLKQHVEILANNYAPRTIEYGTLNATARYIHKQFEKIGNTNYQPFRTINGLFSNVVIHLGPETREILVIGAHYDAKNSSLDIDGNASGVSTLLELARQLSKNQDKLNIGVQLVAYPLSQQRRLSLENMGSYHHAYLLDRDKRKVRLMLSLDNVGSFSEADDSQKYPYQFMHYVYPEKGNYIGLIGRVQDYAAIRKLKRSFKSASKLPMYSFSLPASYYPKGSLDHLSYQQYGYPAMVITDTSDYRKMDIKKTTVEERLDYKKMAMLVKGLYQVVLDTKSKKQKNTGFVQSDMKLRKESEAL